MERNIIMKQIWPTIVFLMTASFFFGLIYPGIVTVINQLFCPEKSNGSLIIKNDIVIGSHLIGQEFISDKYFWSRPSAVSIPYDASRSLGSNLGAANPSLLTNINKRIAQLQELQLESDTPIPVDLVTSSGSGLDPHLSIASANYQVNRVAKARKIEEKVLYELIELTALNRQFGVLGEPRVNVIELNLSLDEISK